MTAPLVDTRVVAVLLPTTTFEFEWYDQDMPSPKSVVDLTLEESEAPPVSLSRPVESDPM